MGGSKILFLGTGGDAFVIGKQYRASGGIIFEFEDNQFHIDPGPGSLVMAKMMGINLRETTAVFITKNDIFRANDGNAVISAMTHEGMDERGVLVCPSSVLIDEDKKKSPFVNKLYKNYLEKSIAVDNTKKIGINNVDIEIIELKGPLENECGIKFITPKFNLAYIPDTVLTNNLLAELEEIDVLILGVREPKGSQKKDCMTSEGAEKIIKKVKPQLAIITGFGVKMLQADPLYEAREIQRETGVQIIAAKDGMSINPISFAATVRQKSLKGF